MSESSGEWLREQRQARGWAVSEMRRKLRAAAEANGDTLPKNSCLNVMLHRWERDYCGVSERYRLHFCRAFQIAPDQFGKPVPTVAAWPGTSGDIGTTQAADSANRSQPGAFTIPVAAGCTVLITISLLAAQPASGSSDT